jgi:diguanylate cyclase (GGDEF)-like protein
MTSARELRHRTPCDDLEACQAALLSAQLTLLKLGGQLRETRAALAASHDRERAAAHAAGHDALTGLPNRRAFDERASVVLRQHVQRTRMLCMVFIDLDGFKTVNDTWGHAAGDALLRSVGERLSRALRSDDFVCRLGGDEFVCLLPNVRHENQALALGRKLMAAIAAPCRIGLHTLQVRASAGLALYPRDGQTVDGLLDRADQALLLAKSRPAARTRQARVQVGA